MNPSIPCGATLLTGGDVQFVLFAPGKQSVSLIGTFNDWDTARDPMEQRPDDHWIVTKTLPEGEHLYQFLLDGKLHICDPYAREVRWQGSFHDQPPAVLRLPTPQFEWQHDGWNRPAFRDLIIYELLIGDFSPERNLRGVINRLDYLQDLGINAIELMPVAEYSGSQCWGYNPSFCFCVEDSYGTPQELKELVDEAHARGIAIILDTVLAHTGREHPFNKMYNYVESPWYGPGLGEQNQFGFPALDYCKAPAKRFVRDVLHFWISEFHIDGYRFDYLKGIGCRAEDGVPFLTRSAREARPDIYLIGEYSPEDAEAANKSGLDAAWHVSACYALKALISGHEYHDYNPSDFERCINALDARTINYSSNDVVVNYSESHDEERTARAIERLCDHDESIRRQKLLATLLLSLPGVPMLFHGQEWGENTAKSQEPNPIHWDHLNQPACKSLRDHFQSLCVSRRNQTPKQFTLSQELVDQLRRHALRNENLNVT